jgi:MFS family permease
MPDNMVAYKERDDRESNLPIFNQQERQPAPEHMQDQKAVNRGSLTATIIATLLVRIAGRISFIILGFYLGAHFASATIVVIVLETFYISELLVAPTIGSLSDRLGRKPFLILAPILAALATTCLLLAARLFPRPTPDVFDLNLVILLLIILAGRLLEGAATGTNVPSTLGYLTDVTIGSERLRGRVVTAFEIVTVGGMALAIPLGGMVSSRLDTWGFLVVIALHLATLLLIFFLVKESNQKEETGQHRNAAGAFLDGLTVIRHKRIYTFLPAWFSVNALVGAWTVLITIMLSYPNPAADARHPAQLLYGGFSKMESTLWVGLFALVFLVGMGLWLLFLHRIRRTTIMLIGLSGLALSMIVLCIVNGLAENPQSLSESARAIILALVPLALIGILLLSGFTPVALTQMGAIAETLPGKRGAVMGLYSVVLAIGQLLGAALGGLFVDLGGFYGLMGFSLIMGLLSLGSVFYIRSHGHDLIRAAGSLHTSA